MMNLFCENGEKNYEEYIQEHIIANRQINIQFK